MWDKYTFDNQRNGFFWNDTPACRKDKGLDPDEAYIIWYNGEHLGPKIQKVEEPVALSDLNYETTVRTVLGTPMWGQRASSAIFDANVTALIYMTPELLKTQEWIDDWRVNMMVGAIDIIVEQEQRFIPLIVPFEEPEELILQPNLS